MTEQVVLVVIDMQNGFVNQHSLHVVPNVVAIVQKCGEQRIPVIFTRFVNQVGSPFERLLGTRLRHRPDVDIVTELAPAAAHVIEKYQYSAFTPEFAGLVQARGWKRLLLCGIATDGCVLKTAVDAFERNLTPVVIRDACASHAGEGVHKAGLLLLARFIGRRQVVDARSLWEQEGPPGTGETWGMA